MNRILIILGLVVLTIHDGFSIDNPQLHFSYKLSKGWDTIPMTVIRAREKQIRAITKNTTNVPHFDGGLFLKANGDDFFTYPYVLYQFQNIKNMNQKSISQIVKELYVDESKTFTFEYKDGMNNFDYKVNTFTVDRTRNLVFLTTKANLPSVGSILSLVVVICGKNGILIYYFSSLEKDYTNFSSQFMETINSFKFDDGFQYKFLSPTKKLK